ncbi:MAG TPA: response regulator [Pirellulales bacterium]|jgi:chemotaxis family two-component system response regulator Rcp1|nr:response regulator [Pirellulales bacterium]
MMREAVGRPMEILLVEDNLSDAQLTYECLNRTHVHHRLTMLWNGAEALDFLHRRGVFARVPRPDLILLDLELPKVDGREVLAEIKIDEFLSSIPVIVLTDSKSDEDRLRSEFMQVDGYVTKPVDGDKFRRLIRELRRFWHDDLILPGIALVP